MKAKVNSGRKARCVCIPGREGTQPRSCYAFRVSVWDSDRNLARASEKGEITEVMIISKRKQGVSVVETVVKSVSHYALFVQLSITDFLSKMQGEIKKKNHYIR